MAIPSSAYQRERVYFRNSINSYICKYTGAHSTVAKAMSAFRLDRLLEVRKNGAVYGFVGMVEDESSNMQYHGFKYSDGPVIRINNERYIICPEETSLVCVGWGHINNVGGSTRYIYLNRTTVSYTIQSTPYLTTRYEVYFYHSLIAEGTAHNGDSRSGMASYNGSLSEGDTAEIFINTSLTEYNVSVEESDYVRMSVKPSITAITAMHLPSKNTMPEDSDWHSTAWIYSADLSALRSRCSSLSMGGEGTTTYPKGGEIVTDLDRTGILSEGYYAIDNNTGFRLISENGGVIYRAFRPMGKTGTWVVSLRAVPSTSPSGSYRYRVNVVMSYTYSGTKPNYDPPSVSLRNFRIRASRSSGGSNDQLAADWQSSNTISDTLSISASKTSDSSSYIYFNKGFSTVYIGLVSSGWTVVSNPSSLRISPGTDTAI